MGRSCLSISEGMHLEIRFKKCGISNQPNVCIFDDPCLSKFGALRGCVRNPQTILGFPSVPCGTRESAHCLWLVGHTPWIVQTWKRHGIRCKHSAGRNAHIFLKRIFHLHFHQKSKGMIFLIYYFSRQKGPSASSDSPSFSFIGSIIFISTPSLVRAWNLRLQ